MQLNHSTLSMVFCIFLSAFIYLNETIAQDTIEPVDMVYPYLDAANSRWFYFSSACRPFGMVNLSPDMAIDGAWDSGYRYNEKKIKFFSHIHAWQLSGVPVMPTTGEFRGHLGPENYQSAYSHENETIFPGYHQVYLEDYDINVELSSTIRVGFHRYTFPSKSKKQILIDLGTNLGPSASVYGEVEQISNNEIQGFVIMDKTIRRPKPIKVFFVVQFDKTFQSLNSWQQRNLNQNIRSFSGKNGGVWFEFSEDEDTEILMKVGISYTSEDEARNNISTELSHWDFDKVVSDSKTHWNALLSRIEIEGNTIEQRRRFYTDLWKSLQGRRIISDASGTYPDMTGPALRIGQIPLDLNGKPNFNHYNSDSFWGAQWTITTLWQLVYPEIAEEFVNSMLLMYTDGGLIPRGPSGGNYTYVMTGASSTPFMVGAYMKGIQGFDAELAFKALYKNHIPGGMMSKAGYEHNSSKGGGIEYYIDKGFVPYPLGQRKNGFHRAGAGQTLEYAYQDWCMAMFAKKLGKEAEYKMFLDRSHNWKHLFDSESGWIRPKNKNGDWKQPFDPYEYGNGFVESNSVQASWYVPHDLPSLAQSMGGNETAKVKLHEAFEKASELDFTSGKSHSDETNRKNRRIPINYGNQPSIQTAFVFNHIGYPWLTQFWSRKVIKSVFSDLSPDFGYSGDEDQGLMGSLAVLMKMGLFEMKSGAELEPMIDLSSPIFDKITIHLNRDYYSGDKIEIIAKGNNESNFYIQNATWNGKSLNFPSIPHRELTKGGKLFYELSDKPNTKIWK